MENRVRKFRRDKEMSQEKLAELADVSRQTIVNIESKENYQPAYSIMLGIAAALDKKVEEIFLA